MRGVSVLLAFSLLLAPGCLEGDDAPGPAADPLPQPAVNATAPDPMLWDGTITFAADVTNLVTGLPCGPLNACDQRSFSINGTFDLTATLTWGLPTNDLDLYLYEGETQVSSDGINTVGDTPGTSQVLVHAALPPGDYTLWVVPWNAVSEDYHLEAVFS